MIRAGRAWRFSRPTLPLIIVMLAVLIASLLMNGGAPASSDLTGRPADRGSAQGQDADQPLVSQTLDDLRAGRTPPSPDDPIAGAVAPITAVKGSSRTRIGRIRIPAIKLDTSFYAGVTADVLKYGPGHWPGTPLPGDPGSSVLSGHRVTNTHPFLDLDRLRPGARISVNLANRTSTFSVVRVSIVAEAQYQPFVLRQPVDRAQRLLTLFACHPKNTHRQRIVVQARALGSG